MTYEQFFSPPRLAAVSELAIGFDGNRFDVELPNIALVVVTSPTSVTCISFPSIWVTFPSLFIYLDHIPLSFLSLPLLSTIPDVFFLLSVHSSLPVNT